MIWGEMSTKSSPLFVLQGWENRLLKEFFSEKLAPYNVFTATSNSKRNWEMVSLDTQPWTQPKTNHYGEKRRINLGEQIVACHKQ